MILLSHRVGARIEKAMKKQIHFSAKSGNRA